MGCLKNVTRAIFLTVVVVDFMAICGQDWIKSWFKSYINQVMTLSWNGLKKLVTFQK